MKEQRAMISKFKSSRGQTLIEFAFIITLLLVLILGIVEFSIIMYDKAMITRASREGARAGAVFRADSSAFNYSPLTEAEIRTVVSNYLQPGLLTFGTPFNAATGVTAMWSTDGGATWATTLPSSHGNGERLRVDVAFTYTFLVLPRLAIIGGGTLNLAARTIMRME